MKTTQNEKQTLGTCPCGPTSCGCAGAAAATGCPCGAQCTCTGSCECGPGCDCGAAS